jgi:hypothetical protein
VISLGISSLMLNSMVLLVISMHIYWHILIMIGHNYHSNSLKDSNYNIIHTLLKLNHMIKLQYTIPISISSIQYSLDSVGICGITYPSAILSRKQLKMKLDHPLCLIKLIQLILKIVKEV